MDESNKLKLSLAYDYEPDPSLDGNLEREVRLIGSCDGLICIEFKIHYELYNEHRRRTVFFLIWNPSIKQQRLIKCPFVSSQYQIVSSGFGYDPSTDDYKIVILAVLAQIGENELVIHVFSSRKSTWRKHKTNYFSPLMEYEYYYSASVSDWISLTMPISVGETLYWLFGSDESGSELFAFNLATESFSLVPLPAIVVKTPKVYSDLLLCKIGQQLCVAWVKTGSIGEGVDGFHGRPIELEVWMLERMNTSSEQPIWNRVDGIQRDYNNSTIQNSFELQDHVFIRMWINYLVSIYIDRQSSQFIATYTKIPVEDQGSTLIRGFRYAESLVSPFNMIRAPRLRKVKRHHVSKYN